MATHSSTEPSTPSPSNAPKHAKSGGQPPKKKKASVVVLSIVLVVLLAGIGVSAWMLWQQNAQLDRAAQEAQDAPVPEAPAQETEEPVDNPIDFATEQAQNPDIYAWIYVPNTNVNYPVLQSPTDDLYYLNNNRYHEWSFEGALFTQSMNSLDFTDPVTVIYGHNNSNGAMFATLHYFENADFFAENDTFYIYTPSSILTYRIVSAYEYDNRHIMNSFDFQNESTLVSYFDSVIHPTSLIANVREGVSLSPTDRIVQLSTCMTEANRHNNRYLVTGVLVDEQPTR